MSPVVNEVPAQRHLRRRQARASCPRFDNVWL